MINEPKVDVHNKRLLFVLPTRLGVSYSTAFGCQFAFKPVRPLRPKIVALRPSLLRVPRTLVKQLTVRLAVAFLSRWTRGVVLKKKWGRLKQDFDKNFLNSLGLHTCCTEIILHCVSVSNQLQQWTNFCTNFSPKKWGEWGTRPPCRKKCGTPSPPLHPCVGCRTSLDQ